MKIKFHKRDNFTASLVGIALAIGTVVGPQYSQFTYGMLSYNCSQYCNITMLKVINDKESDFKYIHLNIYTYIFIYMYKKIF